jgi:hypothetical protein
MKESIVKRVFLVCLATLALTLPATALADTSKPGGGHGNFQGLRQQLKDAAKSCRSASAADRRGCRAKLVAALKTAKSRIEAFKAQIEERCDGNASAGGDASAAGSSPSAGSSSTARPGKSCAHAKKLIERLDALEAKIDKLIEKLQKRRSGGSGSSSGSSSGTDQQVAEIEAGLANLPNP